MKKIPSFASIIIISAFFSNIVFSEEPLAIDKKEPAKYVGKFFDAEVPIENYYFIKGAVSVFGNRFGPQPKTTEEWEKIVWDQLLLSYEAFKRGITVGDEEIEQEIVKILQEEKVTFDWKEEAEAYEKWLKERVNVGPTLFANQIRHFLQVQKLREEIMASIEPPVSDEEALQEFLNEHNSLSVELIQFDEKKDAQEFYKKARLSHKFWDEEKEKRPGDFKRPGFVSLEFLVDIWKFPKEAAYDMLKMKKNMIYKPAPIYKGYGVFKVLEVGPADTKELKKFKTSYYEQIRRRKKHEGLDRWFEEYRRQSNIKIYFLTRPPKAGESQGKENRENKEGDEK